MSDYLGVPYASSHMFGDAINTRGAKGRVLDVNAKPSPNLRMGWDVAYGRRASR